MGQKTRPHDIPPTTKPEKVKERGTRQKPRKEQSYGIIPLILKFSDQQPNVKLDPQDAEAIEVLLVTLKSGGHVSFPKGHAELVDGVLETPMQAAKRELWEETGLEVDEWLLPFKSTQPPDLQEWSHGHGDEMERTTCTSHDGYWTVTEHYKFEHAKKGWIEKTCVYFVATVKNQDVEVQPEEITSFTWTSFLDDVELPTFEASKQVWRLARSALAKSWFTDMIAATTQDILDQADKDPSMFL